MTAETVEHLRGLFTAAGTMRNQDVILAALVFDSLLAMHMRRKASPPSPTGCVAPFSRHYMWYVCSALPRYDGDYIRYDIRECVCSC